MRTTHSHNHNSIGDTDNHRRAIGCSLLYARCMHLPTAKTIHWKRTHNVCYESHYRWICVTRGPTRVNREMMQVGKYELSGGCQRRRAIDDLQIVSASHSRPLGQSQSHRSTTEKPKLIIIFHFCAAHRAIDFFSSIQSATICFTIHSIYATENSMCNIIAQSAGQCACNAFSVTPNAQRNAARHRAKNISLRNTRAFDHDQPLKRDHYC